MNCERPYVTEGGAYGCGQCLPCRVQRQRVWTHRIMLEMTQHKESCFATLTYSDEKLPDGGSLNPEHLTKFIKRLRKATDAKLRYYGVGEYGGRTGRPHYHLALFSYQSCHFGITRKGRASCCPQCDLVARVWGYGNIELGTLEEKSAAYIGGYVSKKYTAPQTDNGRHPQFTRMSLRPGIGTGAMDELASVLLGIEEQRTLIDVPITLRHGTHEWPLGRFLRRKLRTYIGRAANAPPEVLELQKEELQTLRETAWTDQKNLTSLILENSLGKRIQIEQRQRRKKRETA